MVGSTTDCFALIFEERSGEALGASCTSKMPEAVGVSEVTRGVLHRSEQSD